MLKHFFTTYIFCVAVILFESNVAAGQINLPSKNPDRVILNMAQEASNGLTVTWRTENSVSEGFCELQELTGSKINPANTKIFKAKTTQVKYEYEGEPVIDVNQHSCVLAGLTPGMKYLYRVGSEGNKSEWFEFSLPQNDNSRFSFVYFGDPQTDLKSQWSRVVRKAYNTVPDCSFMLYAGDIINRGGRDIEWYEWFEAGSYIFASVPQVLTPGNHDYNDLQIDPHWKYQFTQPGNGPKEVQGTCFFIDYKNLKIVSIDSAVESELEDENGAALKSQKLWLDSILTINTKKWVIVTTHLPFYSPKESRDNPQLRKNFQPILEKHKVDLVLTGHDHSYARGTASDNAAVKPEVMYVVSVSGPKLYEPGDKSWMQFKGGNLQLFQVITIEDDKLDFKAYTAGGVLFDQFAIKKNKNGKVKFTELNKSVIK